MAKGDFFFRNRKRKADATERGNYIDELIFEDHNLERVELQFSPPKSREIAAESVEVEVTQVAPETLEYEKLQQLIAQQEQEHARLIEENQQLKAQQTTAKEQATAYAILSQKVVALQDELTQLRQENHLLKEEKSAYCDFEEAQRKMTEQIQFVHQKINDKEQQILQLNYKLAVAQQQISELSTIKANYQQLQERADALKYLVCQTEQHILTGYNQIFYQVDQFSRGIIQRSTNHMP